MGNGNSVVRRERTFYFEKYFNGRGIDIGCQITKVLPDAVGYDIVETADVDIVGDAEFMAEVGDEEYDWVYSSHCLEDIENVEAALKNWWRILKPGGYLSLVVPHRDYYERKRTLPSVGNAGHKHFFLPFISEPPDTLSLYELLRTTLPDAFIIFLNECTEGTAVQRQQIDRYPPKCPPEVSIEAVLQKGSYTPMFEKGIDIRTEFSEWARHNPHNLLISFPRSGRNWLGALLRGASGKMVAPGVLDAQPTYYYKDLFIFMFHRGRWDILGDKGKYILLIRDPRDAILSRTYMRAQAESRSVESLFEDSNWMLELNIDEWRRYFDTYLQYEPLVVQYEKLCLDQAKVVAEILEFLVNDIRPDAVNDEPISASGQAHYDEHCMKWKRGSVVPESFLSAIWSRIGDLMTEYGYSEGGYSA